MEFLKILKKDFLVLFRQPQLLLALYFFSFVLTFIFSFAFLSLGLPSSERLSLCPAILTISTLFISCLLFNQTQLCEKNENAMLGLVYSGYAGATLFASKGLTNFLVLASIGIFELFGLHFFFLELPFSLFTNFLVVSLILSFTLAALGTLLALISVVASTRELLFPVIFFPLSIPALGAALTSFREIAAHQEIDFLGFPVTVLIASAVIFTTLGALLFEEAL